MAEYLQVQTPSSPSGDIGCAPDNAGCSAGGAYLAYLEEEAGRESLDYGQRSLGLWHLDWVFFFWWVVAKSSPLTLLRYLETAPDWIL